MKTIITLSIILFASTFAYSQDVCPADKVCISREAALKAIADDATVKAQATELAAKDQAIADLRAELNNMRVQFAEKSGENTILKQQQVRDMALVDLLLKQTKKKRNAFISIL